MRNSRIIPCLLIEEGRLVKTKKFSNPTYIGDPVNAVRIFSEKEADEIIVLDIGASRLGLDPDYQLISEMAGEAFMPLTYGGGIRSLEQVRRLIRSGVDKVAVNTYLTESTDLIRAISATFGSQSIVGVIDVKQQWRGNYSIMTHSATKKTNLRLESHIDNLIRAGIGELFVNDINRDGMMNGLNVDLVMTLSNKVRVPIVICGGAGTLEHLRDATISGHASGVAAGSMFVFHGKHRAVLINYPSYDQLLRIISK